MKAFTKELVQLALAINPEKIPATTLDTIRLLVLDGLSALFSGLSHPTTKILKRYFKDSLAPGGLPLPRRDIAHSAADSAFIYGAAIHVLDYEPMFHPPTHAVSPVLGALLALGLAESQESLSLMNKHQLFLKAFAAGIQLQADLRKGSEQGDAIARDSKNFFPFQRQGFHPPGTVGVMGSALAASIWLGLSEEETCIALGMATSRAGGASGNIGFSTKSTHSANAARAGIECALLAKLGITANHRTFEAGGGWAEIFGGENFDHEQLLKGMSNLDCFTHPGFAFKKWPAHTAMQVTIQTALALHVPNTLFDGTVHITAPVFNYCDRPFPKSSDECRFSFQFNAVQAILDGKVTADSYTEKQLARTDIQHLLNRTTLTMLPEIPPTFTDMAIHIHLSDGRSAYGDQWPGHWKNPADYDTISKKFLSCSEGYFSKAEQYQITHAIFSNEMPIDAASLFLSLLKANVDA
jgi:aconitate decarboxylase